MFDVEDIADWQDAVLCRDGRYRPARPMPGFFRQRLRDAWAVFRGDAVAVRLFSGHEPLADLPPPRP